MIGVTRISVPADENLFDQSPFAPSSQSRRLYTAALDLVAGIDEAHDKMAFRKRAFRDRQLELVGALAAVSPRGHDLQIGRLMLLARLEEQDRSSRRDLPGDGVADGHMRDIFVVGENNLRRGANDAVDLDDVGRIVGHHPHARRAGRRKAVAGRSSACSAIRSRRASVG